jgi:glycosyltransferase involved in cell wall biosynthesis
MPGILILSDINSAHTRKWALSLADKGYRVGIFSLNKNTSDWFKGNNNIEFLSEGALFNVAAKKEAGKAAYLKALPALKLAITVFKPDIVHAHYATSYGLLGALSRFHPYVISVWGSDVYDFPRKSILHKNILKRNLKKADCIMSTSHSMAKETAKYTNKKIEITPFGIDLNEFKPQKVKSVFNESDIVVGTVKALEPKYGINYLIEAFDILQKRHSQLPLKLLIVGGGSQLAELTKLCEEKGITDKVKFAGRVPHDQVPIYHNMLDVYVALSVDDSESFGVAVIEAMACGKPVVVSDVSGFVEVVENNVSGIIVPRRNAEEAAKAIGKLITDKELAVSIGNAGRKRVEELYDWSANLKQIMGIYDGLLKGVKK